MADTVTDALTATLRTTLTWNRTETQELGTIRQRATRTTNYTISDGSDAGEADLVFTDTRTINAGLVEVIDLLNLTQQTLGVAVPYTFRQVRVCRVVNNETAAGRRILVGADPGRPTVVYASEIGPGSEVTVVNRTDAWRVTADNSLLRIANPNAVSVSYSIYLVGTSVQAGGSGGS